MLIVCEKKLAVALRGTKQEGEECGPCFNPSINFDCGSCGPGLECKEASDSAILPDATATCQLSAPPLPPLGDKNQINGFLRYIMIVDVNIYSS